MSVKLLTVEGAVSTTSGICSARNGGTEQVSVTSDALTTIGELPQSPLNLITIWGHARTGKSYIMNLLARRGKEDIFPVSGGFKACTVGADMSKATVGLAPFKQASDAAGEEELEEGGSPEIGFVDVEGQGNRHRSHGILLATPLLLLSKVVIFNWLGKPRKTTVLDELATMSEAATFINRGQQAGAFGHLVLLLRDVRLDGEKEVYSIVFENEELDDAGTDEAARGIEERNKIRNLLHKAFKTIRVVCMPLPHADIDIRSVGVDEVEPSFAAKLSGLRDTLSVILREPHQFGGQPVVGGGMFISLLFDLCERVNQGAKDTVPLGLMKSIHQRRAQSALEQASEIFKTTISALEDGPAQSMAATANILEQVKTRALDKFAMDTQGLDKRTVTKAQAKLDATIRELTMSCKNYQERRVADAKTKVVEIMESVTRKIDDEEMKVILSALPIAQGRAALNRLWAQKCQEWHEFLKHSIKMEVPVGLHEDLEPCVPALVFFQSSMNGKLEQLHAVNQQLMEAQQENEKDSAQQRPSKDKAAAAGTFLGHLIKGVLTDQDISRKSTRMKAKEENCWRTVDDMHQEGHSQGAGGGGDGPNRGQGVAGAGAAAMAGRQSPPSRRGRSQGGRGGGDGPSRDQGVAGAGAAAIARRQSAPSGRGRGQGGGGGGDGPSRGRGVAGAGAAVIARRQSAPSVSLSGRHRTPTPVADV